MRWIIYIYIYPYSRFWRCWSYIRLLRKTKRCDLDHTLHYNMKFVVMWIIHFIIMWNSWWWGSYPPDENRHNLTSTPHPPTRSIWIFFFIFFSFFFFYFLSWPDYTELTRERVFEWCRLLMAIFIWANLFLSQHSRSEQNTICNLARRCKCCIRTNSTEK